MFWQMDRAGRDTDASTLTEYIGRDDHELRNRRGEPMSDREIESFVARSEKFNHEKQIVISPEDGNRLTDDELSLAARRNMSEFVRDRPTADYCYAIHRDTDHAHVQVALTGTKRDLYASKEDRVAMRKYAEEHFGERERRHERARREREREQEQERERERQSRRWRGAPPRERDREDREAFERSR